MTAAEEGAREAALTLARDVGRQAAEVKPILMATHTGKTIGCCARNAGRLFHEEERDISMVCPPCFELSDDLFAGSCVFGFYPMILL